MAARNGRWDPLDAYDAGKRDGFFAGCCFGVTVSIAAMLLMMAVF